ncbi:MAG: ATP-binding protein [Alloprevotella sp.]
MNTDIQKLIGEATAYDKKQMLEIKRPKSWLKSVSAFANGEGGTLIFGISDDGHVAGLADAKGDAERISEEIKSKLDPVPTVNLELKEADGGTLVLLHVYPGQETPYYYIGDKQRLAFVRIGNESVVADRTQLKNLVMSGSGRTYDSLPSNHRFEDMAFSKLKSVHYKRLQRSFEDNEFVSWGIIDENGKLTNAGALLADESPVRQSRIFCTRWNGLDMTSGLGEAIDDVELEGCVIGQLQDAVSFVRNNSRKKWWKENDYREELPDYPERAVTEAITNAIIHRDYMQMGSEIHIDMYDDRLEIYSPGGMVDGRLIQQLNPLAVPSKRRNPLLADFFSRLGLMERRGSGMKKIMETYRRYEHLSGFRAPEFTSNASEFHVTLWNLKCDGAGNNIAPNSESQKAEFTKEPVEFTKEFTKEFVKEPSEFVKEPSEFVKESVEFTKEFVKARRQIYKLISMNSKVNTVQMADSMGLSRRQILKYLRRLQELGKIARVGGRKMGEWKIVDEEYEGFFERI